MYIHENEFDKLCVVTNTQLFIFLRFFLYGKMGRLNTRWIAVICVHTLCGTPRPCRSVSFRLFHGTNFLFNVTHSISVPIRKLTN